MNEKHRVKSDGLELAVETFGQGPPLIYAHGLSGTHLSAVRKFTHLADRYRIIAFDQRGHCRSSPVTDPALYGVDRMAGDIGAILDHLGIERAFVGGESMGAATALRFALSRPERVAALFLLAPAFGDRPNPERERVRAQGRMIVAEGLEAFLAVSAEEQRAQGMPEEIIAYLAERLRTHDPISLATAYQAVVDWILFDDVADLAALDLPVRVVAWKNDPLHEFRLAERTAAALPNARLEIFPSVLEFFSNPASLGDMCHRFLAGLAA